MVIMKNLKLATRESEQRTIVKISNVEVGHGFTVIAGPCSVESEEQVIESATVEPPSIKTVNLSGFMTRVSSPL